MEVPLRVDFAGGWLDVPQYARKDGYIVNCAISPLVSLDNWPYRKFSGLGGSGAWWLLNGKDPVQEELNMGAGWQDAAVIQKTGLCTWYSGVLPELDRQYDGEWLRGRMAIYDTGKEHSTVAIAKRYHPIRDYEAIARNSDLARRGVIGRNFRVLAEGVNRTYKLQLDEQMDHLPFRGEEARKYCGSGHGGYALYLFREQYERDAAVKDHPEMMAVEPYYREDA